MVKKNNNFYELLLKKTLNWYICGPTDYENSHIDLLKLTDKVIYQIYI